MDTLYYREFIVLCDVLNYAEAADRLSLSESSLSRHIKAMESELGVQLFERTTRSIKLTSYGHIVLHYAKKIVELEGNCISSINAARQKEKNTIRVCTTYYIDDLLTCFRRKHNEVVIKNLRTDENIGTMLNMLRAGEADVAFIDEEIADDDLITETYTQDSYVAILPLNHPLAGRTRIGLKELAN